MRTSVIALALVAVAGPALGDRLTLAEALDRAVARSPSAAAVRAAIPVARADVRSAGMWPNPSLGVSVGTSEPVFSASSSWRLPILGQRGTRVAAAERGVDQARAEADATLWRVRRDARVAYFAAARADEERAIAIEVAAIARRIAGIARARFDVGSGSRLDAEQATLVDARARRELDDRAAAARVAHLDLARVVGSEAGTPIELDDTLDRGAVLPSLATLLAALDRHPEVRQLEAERRAAEARADAARAEVRPVPTVDVGVELLDASTCAPMGNARCVGPRAGLSIDVPLLSWNRGPVERAEAEARLAQRRQEAALRRLAAELHAAWESVAAAADRARYYETSDVPASRDIEAMAREGYAAGKTGLLPLLEAERAVLESRRGRADALLALQTARADLEEASGVAIP